MLMSSIIQSIEQFAPLSYQEEWDNSGLQVGFPSANVSKVLLCLDVTESIVDEALARGCDLIVSHHPLLFRSIKQISDAAYQQRCVVKAIQGGIGIYSAHTSLDNAPRGVNDKIADVIGLEKRAWLLPSKDGVSGSGLLGHLPRPMATQELLSLLKSRFKLESLRYSSPCEGMIESIAICGGSGASLMREAVKAGAQCFITGEASYHDHFETEGMMLIELGHYQSEQYTIDLLYDYLVAQVPELQIVKTLQSTNPILYR